ncbi:hypothetical protein [Halogeometricum limi]|uniref:Membrane domain of glycerophosphoryl diester phosphodiesterase n=1 Tax=Halogeometricum limi TaxID=555875 RepID=A0A1I6HEH2_9EURY|nr:hypothetical protein [Halogeometricum limi]SFR52768.1 hypothetical protein SAMN04488124_2131 [Halogeometricum limi]
MVSDSIPFTDRLADGWRRSADAVWLAFVPVLTALFSVDKLASVAEMDGFHVGVNFLGFPSPAENVWQFVSTPQSGVVVDLTSSLSVLFVSFVVTTPLLGGYLGSVRRLLDDGETDLRFVDDALAYLAPMAVWVGVPTAATGALAVTTGGFRTVPGSGGLLPLVLLLFVAYVVLGYLFYAAPFLVALRETGLVDALRASYGLAVDGGPYAAYTLGYVLFVVVVSPFATLLVVNLGVLGLALGVPLGARLGLAATTATMRFLADVDDRSPTLRSWSNDRDDGNRDDGDRPLSDERREADALGDQPTEEAGVEGD